MDFQVAKTFKEIVAEKAIQYKTKIATKLKDHKYSLKLFKDEHDRIQMELTKTYDSSLEFNAVFHKLYDDSIENKHVEHIDLCEEYCKTHHLPYDHAVPFFTSLFYLHEIDRWILDQKRTLEELLKEKEIQLKERKEGEFTNTRRILATYFLFKAAGKEIRYGEDEGINKTRIAEFAQFLVSKESNPKNIRDTQIYSRVKKLWNREDLMLIDDLSYIAQEFKDAGLHNIAQEIEQIINKRESEEI